MVKTIKVLHTEWSDGWGGQEIRIINEMVAVRKLGVDVFLACRDNATVKQKAIENDIKVFTMPFKGNADFKTLFKIRKIIKEHGVDIVNTHSGKDTWVGGLAAKLSGVKFIRTRHLSNPIRSSRTNFINELADYIFTTGESVRTNMIDNNRIKPEVIESIPTGVDAHTFSPEKYNKDKCRKKFHFKETEIVIGIVAVLRQFKRHDLFIEMAKQLIIKYPDKKFKFLIAGDGPGRETIKKLILDCKLSDSIIMLGHSEQVPELLSALDIFVLSSDSKEGVPQSVMQALFMDVPVVATNSGSTKDLLNGNNFQLVDTNSSLALVKGVSYYLDGDKINKIESLIEEKFSLDFMSKRIVDVYGQLLKK